MSTFKRTNPPQIVCRKCGWAEDLPFTDDTHERVSIDHLDGWEVDETNGARCPRCVSGWSGGLIYDQDGPDIWTEDEQAAIRAIFSGEHDGWTVKELREWLETPPPCPHDSLDGIDQEWGPDKVWRCCACEGLFRRVDNGDGTSHLVAVSGGDNNASIRG